MCVVFQSQISGVQQSPHKSRKYALHYPFCDLLVRTGWLCHIYCNDNCTSLCNMYSLFLVCWAVSTWCNFVKDTHMYLYEYASVKPRSSGDCVVFWPTFICSASRFRSDLGDQFLARWGRLRYVTVRCIPTTQILVATRSMVIATIYDVVSTCLRQASSEGILLEPRFFQR